jgi:hypothetical protein
MKKLIGIFLVLAMLLSLAACTGEPDISGDITPPGGNSNPSDPTGDSTPSEPSEPDLSLGGYEGGIYQNDYLGLTCTLGTGWKFYSAKELQTLPDDIANALEGTPIGDKMGSITQITDMMAENTTDLTTVNVLFTKLDLTSKLLYASMTEDQIADSILAQSDLIKQSYQQMGITVKEMKKVTVTFLGETHTAIWTDATYQGVAYYILQVYDYHLGDYGATITMASFLEDKTASLLSLFSKQG